MASLISGAHSGEVRAGEEEVLDLPGECMALKSGFALDIGGSMIKLVYVTDEGSTVRLHFSSYPRHQINDAIALLKNKFKGNLQKGTIINTCGNGFQAYTHLINEELDVIIKNNNEMDCFCVGFRFLMKNRPLADVVHPQSQKVTEHVNKMVAVIMAAFASLEKFSDGPTKKWGTDDQKETADSSKPETETPTGSDVKGNAKEAEESQTVTTESDVTKTGSDKAEADLVYPILMCMIGSAAGIFKVERDGTYQFLEISTRGGRSFVGLGKLLTGAQSYDELIELASKGDIENVHTMGRHIKTGVGEDAYSQMSDDAIVYCFGQASDEQKESFRREDLAAGLLNTVSQDLAQTCHMTAMSYNIKQIFVCGSFPGMSQLVRDEIGKWLAFRCIMNAQNVQYQYHFLKLGGYYGALGALLKSVQQEDTKL